MITLRENPILPSASEALAKEAPFYPSYSS